MKMHDWAKIKIKSKLKLAEKQLAVPLILPTVLIFFFFSVFFLDSDMSGMIKFFGRYVILCQIVW